MNKRLKAVVGAAVGLVMIGCTSRVGDLTVASTKNIMISSFNPSTMTSTRVEGKHCKAVILGFPTGFPNMEDAIDNALLRGATGANFLTDAVISYKTWTAIVYGQNCFVVTGNAWVLRVASNETDPLRDLAVQQNTGSDVRVDLNDGSSVSGALIGFGSSQLVVRPAGDGAVQVLDRALVSSVTPIE